MPPDLRAAGSGDIDSSMLQTSTNRLLLQSWLPDGGSAHALAHKSKAKGELHSRSILHVACMFIDSQRTAAQRRAPKKCQMAPCANQLD